MSNSKPTIQSAKEDFFAALMLLTRIPVNWQKVSPSGPPDLNRCLWIYPIIGLVVSIIGAAVYFITVWMNIPQSLSVIIALAAMIFATGAFHEDGLADVADGFGGGNSAEKKLEIMRDSRIGTYGGLALVIAVALKVTSLSVLSSEQIIAAFISAGMISRLMIIYTLLVLNPARKDSLSSDAGKPSTNAIIVATLSALLISGLLIDPTVVIYIFITAFATTLAFCVLAHRQISGFSGDVLGAVQQLSEITIYIFLSALWSAA